MAPRKPQTKPRAVSQNSPETDPKEAARAAAAGAISDSLGGRRPCEQFVAKLFWLVLRQTVRDCAFVGGAFPTAIRVTFNDGSVEELPWRK
mgnify:CR=1 FL=1